LLRPGTLAVVCLAFAMALARPICEASNFDGRWLFLKKRLAQPQKLLGKVFFQQTIYSMFSRALIGFGKLVGIQEIIALASGANVDNHLPGTINKPFVVGRNDGLISNAAFCLPLMSHLIKNISVI